MKKDLQEELFASMLRSAFQEKVNTQEPEDVPPHKFSPEFERKMHRLVRRTERQAWRQAHRKTLQRAAAMFALVIVLGGVLVTKVDAVRVPVLSFVFTIEEKFSQIDIVGDKEPSPLSGELEEFLPSYVPEGFWLDAVDEENDQFFVSYVAEDGRGYYINFRTSTDGCSVDTEEAVVEQREINGYPGVIIQKELENIVLWYPQGHEYLIAGTVSLEEIFCILESIRNFS
ncbi:MAG: DUF4367 domain-containing protein [Ruminiclostridium sp.]|jgi:hypothetical protein|nr:DUF4367 domain-containing protein [Ruminiclostridium sp.]